MTSRPHTIHLPDDLWERAQSEARNQSVTTSSSVSTTSIVVAALTGYLETQMDVPLATSPTARPHSESEPTMAAKRKK